MIEPWKDPNPNCTWCLGTGVVDSGGFTPWDEPINIRCGCTYLEPILVNQSPKLRSAIEHHTRIYDLMLGGMTRRAATIVIDAAMYGKGCIEGEVREKIERAKPPCGHTGYCTTRCLY